MKKHRLHDIVLGMLLMALVMGLAIPALAATVKTIEANYMDIKLVVDGVPITPKDANGNVVEPFAFEGTTYLPVRAVGEALGKDVKWDGETKTVYIGVIPGKINYLVDICPPYQTEKYEEYHSTNGEFFQMGGKDYSNGFTLRQFNSGGYAYSNLNGEYSTLTADIGYVDNSNGSFVSDFVVKVYLDGEFAQEIVVPHGALPQKISIPLNYAMQIEFRASTKYAGKCGFANIILE